MKIDEALITKGFKDGTIQYEAHERVPLFIVEPNSVLVDGEESYLITDTFKTYNVGGVLYAKMDSTHKNPNGTFSGAEPTYSNDMSTVRQTLWAEQFELVTSETFEKLRRWDSMTFEERQVETIKTLKAEKNNVAFELEVYSSAKGEELKYTINLKSYSELQTQYSMGGAVATHDDSRTLHEAYTNEEAGILLYDIGKAVAERECIYDLWITRATMMTEETDALDMVKNIPITAEEQAYIDSIVGGLG